MMKVFIVEDHPAFRQSIVEAINREAGDVQLAPAAIETSQPGAGVGRHRVLTDIFDLLETCVFACVAATSR